MKLLVTGMVGASVRFFDVHSYKNYRAFERNFPSLDFCPGSLLDCEIEHTGDLISSMTVHDEVVGDCTKTKVEVRVDEVKRGDLVDGVPVMNLGRAYAKKGVKVALAYFVA